MGQIFKGILIFALLLVLGSTLIVWAAGSSDRVVIGTAINGLIVVAVFWFVISTLVKLIFLDLRSAWRSLAAVVLVLLLLWYLLPIIDFITHHPVYFTGFDISLQGLLWTIVAVLILIGLFK